MSAADQILPPTRPARAIGLTLLFTGFIAATYGFGVYLFPALMPDMLAALALKYGDAGTIMAASQAGFLIAALISGLITNRIGAVRLIMASVACCAACLTLVPFATGITQLAIILFASGAASAAVWVPMVVVAKAIIPAAHQGKALGLMSSGTAYGVFLNGAAIPILLPTYGWQSVWMLVAAITFVLFAWGWFALSGVGRAVAVTDSADGRSETIRLSEVLRPAYLFIPAMMFLSGVACMPTQNYLVALVRDELGYGIDAAGSIWKVIGFIGMFGGFAMGILADKISVKRALVLSYLSLAVSLIAFVDHRDIAIIYVGAGVFGLSFNAIFGLIPAYVSLTYPSRTTAMIFGVGNVMLGLGAMAGNFLGGYIKDETNSFQAVYLSALVLAVFLVLCAAFLKKPNGSPALVSAEAING